MERVQTKLRRSEKGFTLVELAIVMIIIGLLISGILKGQELIANAQVTSTVAQVKAIDAAFSTFRDTFNTVPGDMTNAAVRLPAVCTGTCDPGAGANGNGRIDADAGVVPVTEGLAAFTQMAAIDLLSGLNPTPVDAPVNIGDEVPAASIRGSTFRLGYVSTAGGAPTGNQGGAIATWRTGHYLAITGDPLLVVGAAATAGEEGAIAVSAGRIDLKLDDGNPIAGFVRAGGGALCATATDYDATLSTQKDCTLFIRIQG